MNVVNQNSAAKRRPDDRQRQPNRRHSFRHGHDLRRPTTYSGNTTIAPGTSLTADQILQNTLSIGAGATVTIRPSGGGSMDAAQGSGVGGRGHGKTERRLLPRRSRVAVIPTAIATTATQAALATDNNSTLAIEQLQNRIAILSNLAADNPEFDVSLATAEDSLLSLESNIGSSDAETALSFNASDSGGLAGGPAAVPEPSTFVLLALAGLLLFARIIHGRSAVIRKDFEAMP